MYANGGDLSRRIILRPYAGKAGDALGDYAQVAAGTDENFFQLTDKINSADARLKGAQIKYGITNELARAMESYVTAAVSLMQLNSVGGQELTRSDDILLFGI